MPPEGNENRNEEIEFSGSVLQAGVTISIAGFALLQFEDPVFGLGDTGIMLTLASGLVALFACIYSISEINKMQFWRPFRFRYKSSGVLLLAFAFVLIGYGVLLSGPLNDVARGSLAWIGEGLDGLAKILETISKSIDDFLNSGILDRAPDLTPTAPPGLTGGLE